MANTADEPGDTQHADKGCRPHSEHLDTADVGGPTFASPEQRIQDLSDELMMTLPRSKGELVRCRRIVGERYRCNWWGSRDAGVHDNTGGSGVMITRYRVVKSRMLRATVTLQGLAIDADSVQ